MLIKKILCLIPTNIFSSLLTNINQNTKREKKATDFNFKFTFLLCSPLIPAKLSSSNHFVNLLFHLNG